MDIVDIILQPNYGQQKFKKEWHEMWFAFKTSGHCGHNTSTKLWKLWLAKIQEKMAAQDVVCLGLKLKLYHRNTEVYLKENVR